MNLRLLFLLLLSHSAFCQLSFGEAVKINTGWKFHPGDLKDGQAPELNDSRWRTVQLPHDWSVRGQHSPTLASATGYLPGGIGWYRKKWNVPAEASGKKIYLYFEGVYNRSEVFVNGQSLGKRPNGYISFAYDATPYIKYGQENQVAVRVDHSQSADSRWYTGSGIYRDVYAVYSGPVHIAQWGVFAYPEIKGSRGTLHVEVSVDNESPTPAALQVITELLDHTGKVVAVKTSEIKTEAGKQATVKTALALNNPRLWSLADPYLYTLKTIVKGKNKVLDQTVTTTGFRSFTFDPDKGFALNGQLMKMKGVCIHHDAGVLGAAVPREVWKKRLLTLKEIGVNAVRTSHNPQAPDLYALCDELGLLVMNEAYDEWEYPKRKWLEGNTRVPGSL